MKDIILFLMLILIFLISFANCKYENQTAKINKNKYYNEIISKIDKTKICYWCEKVCCEIYPNNKELQNHIRKKCLKNQKERKQKYINDKNNKSIIDSYYINWCKNQYDFLTNSLREIKK